MISDRNDYWYIDVPAWMRLTGDPMPYHLLRGETMMFLAEALAERQVAVGRGPLRPESFYQKNGPSASDAYYVCNAFAHLLQSVFFNPSFDVPNNGMFLYGYDIDKLLTSDDPQSWKITPESNPYDFLFAYFNPLNRDAVRKLVRDVAKARRYFFKGQSQINSFDMTVAEYEGEALIAPTYGLYKMSSEYQNRSPDPPFVTHAEWNLKKGTLAVDLDIDDNLISVGGFSSKEEWVARCVNTNINDGLTLLVEITVRDASWLSYRSSSNVNRGGTTLHHLIYLHTMPLTHTEVDEETQESHEVLNDRLELPLSQWYSYILNALGVERWSAQEKAEEAGYYTASHEIDMYVSRVSLICGLTNHTKLSG